MRLHSHYPLRMNRPRSKLITASLWVIIFSLPTLKLVEQVRTLEQTVESLQATVEHRTEEASTLLQNLQQEFDSAEESRQEQFTEKEKEFQTHTEEILEAKKEEWSKLYLPQTEYEELYESINENSVSKSNLILLRRPSLLK